MNLANSTHVPAHQTKGENYYKMQKAAHEGSKVGGKLFGQSLFQCHPEEPWPGGITTPISKKKAMNKNEESQQAEFYY